MILNSRLKYIQIAFNRSKTEVGAMIRQLPASDRILIEAGTPFVKQYGQGGIRWLARQWRDKVGSQGYIIADLKCMDRGFTEVQAAKSAGASAVTCLGLAPLQTIEAFIATCNELGVDSMIDMMNVEFPFEILQHLKKLPDIVVLHRGADEALSSTKAIPYHNITSIVGTYNTVISVAGGESVKDAQRAFFNGASIAVVWKEFFENPALVGELADIFLSSIKGYARK
jgi:3-keto-L-gulonate-6-phosphate decarboxylase